MDHQHIYHCKFCDQEITRRGIKICRGCGAEIWWPSGSLLEAVLGYVFLVFGLAVMVAIIAIAAVSLYEGIQQAVRQSWAFEVWTVGNYIKIGGSVSILGIFLCGLICCVVLSVRRGSILPPKNLDPVFSRPRAGSSWSIGFGFFKF